MGYISYRRRQEVHEQDRTRSEVLRAARQVQTRGEEARREITGVISNDCSWQIARTAEHDGAQVDLLIDRKDGVINLCEMKFAAAEYEIKEPEERRMRARKELFKETVGTRKAVHLTYVTTYGLKRNKHSGIVQSEVTLDDLFRSP